MVRRPLACGIMQEFMKIVSKRQGAYVAVQIMGFNTPLNRGPAFIFASQLTNTLLDKRKQLFRNQIVIGCEMGPKLKAIFIA